MQSQKSLCLLSTVVLLFGCFVATTFLRTKFDPYSSTMSIYNNFQSKCSILGRNTVLAMNTSFYQFYIFGRLQHPWFYTNISRTVSCLVKLTQNWDSSRFSSVHSCQAVYCLQSLCAKKICFFLSSASTILVFQKYRIDLLQIIFLVDHFKLWYVNMMAVFEQRKEVLTSNVNLSLSVTSYGRNITIKDGWKVSILISPQKQDDAIVRF